MTRPRTLGVILAGGKSSRFGSDKALAEFEGRPLIAHVADMLAGQCDAIAVAGRDWGGLVRVNDTPEPGLGPLGGLLGALHHAEASGFDQVLTSGCDLIGLPGDLIALLSPAPALFADQPTIGLWPAALADRLAAFIKRDARRSIRGWAAEAGARTIAPASAIANVNYPSDLEAFRRRADPRSSP